MSKVNLTVIKNWFKTGLKPTQTQFWDTWDSFFHKDDQIPIAQVEGIQNIYDTINNHINNPTAHAQILLKSRIYPFGTLQIFKKFENLNEDDLEIGDFGAGFINETTFMPFGIFLGGNPKELASWDTSPMYYPTIEVAPILPISGEVI